MSAYTEAEIDAVHEFAWKAIDGVSGAGSHNAAKALLDRIAPAIAARALREAAKFWGEHPDLVDDETPSDCRDWLRDRADEIEATS